MLSVIIVKEILIPFGKEELDYNDEYRSWIRGTDDREIANCTVEYDEVLKNYIVRCIATSVVDQELSLLVPSLVKSRREVYRSIAIPTVVPTALQGYLLVLKHIN
jgi:hypothetical protein